MIFRRLAAVPDFLSTTSTYLPPPSLHVLTFILNWRAFCIRIFAFFVRNVFAMCVVFRSLESLRWPYAMGWSQSSCVCDVRRPSFVVRSPLTSSPQKQVNQSEPNLVWSIWRVRRQEIVNFTTPSPSQGEEIYGLKNVKLIYFFKNLLLYTRQRLDKLVSIYI